MNIDKRTQTILRDPFKRRVWIRYQLTLMGTSLASVARAAGVTKQCIYQVFNKPYPRMEALIADALDMSPAVLFPERYGPDGLPIYRMGRPLKKSTNKTINKTRETRNVKDPSRGRHDQAA